MAKVHSGMANLEALTSKLHMSFEQDEKPAAKPVDEKKKPAEKSAPLVKKLIKKAASKQQLVQKKPAAKKVVKPVAAKKAVP